MEQSIESRLMEYEPLFGRWHVTRRLGAGANGSVYEIEAECDADGEAEHSALKVITVPALGDDEVKALLFTGMSEERIRSYYKDVAENILKDYDSIKRLGSNNIVHYEESEVRLHKDGPGMDILFRMELLTPMLDYFSDYKASESDVLRMGIDICRALEACRQQGFIHRDIKPANILVSKEGVFKLGDFGVAKIIEETQSSLSKKGTYTYMAPEVYRGEAYGQTADIYSLGMVLYECLNDGRSIFLPPFPEDFDADDKVKAFAKRVRGRQFAPPVHGSEELKSIVMKACAFNEEDRWQTASEMREALVQVAGEAPDMHIADHTVTADNRKWKIAVRVFFAVALLFTVFGLVFPWRIESISGPADGTEIYISDELAPDYVIEPDFYADKTISFASSDENIFTVDENGVISAVGMGEASLIMRADDFTEDDFEESVRLTVVPKVTRIDNIPDPVELTTGDTLDLEPELRPAEFADEKVTYKIKDSEVAGVSKKGRLKAKKAGETVLTLYAGGCTLETVIKVSDPVIVYTPPAYTSSGSGSKKKSGNKNNKGTFSQFEYFDGD